MFKSLTFKIEKWITWKHGNLSSPTTKTKTKSKLLKEKTALPNLSFRIKIKWEKMALPNMGFQI